MLLYRQLGECARLQQQDDAAVAAFEKSISTAAALYGDAADETSECRLALARAFMKMSADTAAEPILCQVLETFVTRHGPLADPVLEVQGNVPGRHQ